jgi:cation transport ATPase
LGLVIAGATCTLACGYPIFHEAVENILERRMTMELSMAIAILAALAIREVFTALVITLFVLVAEVLEGLTVGRGRRAIRHLIDLLPSTATVGGPDKWSAEDCLRKSYSQGKRCRFREEKSVVDTSRPLER